MRLDAQECAASQNFGSHATHCSPNKKIPDCLAIATQGQAWFCGEKALMQAMMGAPFRNDALKPSLVGISLYPSIPPYNGGSNRIFNISTALSESFDVRYLSQKFSLRALVKPQWIAANDSYREFVYMDPLSALAYVAGRAARLPQLAHANVLQLTAPKWMVAHIRQADVVVVDQPWTFKWAQSLTGNNSVTVYSAQNVEADMFRRDDVKLPRFLKDAALTLISEQEKFAAQRADLVLVTSTSDREKMIAQYGAAEDRIHVAPNGVDCSLFVPASDERRAAVKRRFGLSEKKTILFCGARHPPNTEAVKVILEWARVETDESLHFVIVGSVSKSFPDVQFKNVLFTGYIDDVMPYYEMADVAINPVRSGGGSSVKQIEYLAAGIPSVATEFGARGFDLVDGKHYVSADIQAFPASTKALLRNKALADRLRVDGREIALRKFDWGAIAMMAASLYREALEGKRKRP